MTVAAIAPAQAERERLYEEAEGRLGRRLRPAERRIDIAGNDRTLEEGKAALAAAIEEERLRAVRAAARAIRAGTPPRPSMELTGPMRAILEGLWHDGAAAAAREVREADVPWPASYATRDPRLDALLAGLRSRLALIETRIARAGVELTLQRGDAPGISLAAMAREIERRSPGSLDAASRVVSGAFNGGMGATFDQVEGLFAGWLYSAVMDGATCDVCRAGDGTEYDTWEEISIVLPDGGPNPACYGNGRCRCRAVPIPEREPDEEQPSAVTPPPRSRRGDLEAPDADAMEAIAEGEAAMGSSIVADLVGGAWPDVVDESIGKAAAMRLIAARMRDDPDFASVERWLAGQRTIGPGDLAPGDYFQVGDGKGYFFKMIRVLDPTEGGGIEAELFRGGVPGVHRLRFVVGDRVRRVELRPLSTLRIGDEFDYLPGKRRRVRRIGADGSITHEPAARSRPGDTQAGEQVLTREAAESYLVAPPRTYELARTFRGFSDDPVEEMTSNLIANWAGTSADGDPLALALQRAVAKEFDLPVPTFLTTRTGWGDEELWRDLEGTLRVFIRSMYAETQAELRRRGITELLLYRGVSHLPPGRPVGVVRGDLELQPASSFSFDPETAWRFHGTDGGVYAVRVPAERVLGIPGRGWGCANEWEVVLLSGRKDRAWAWLAERQQRLSLDLNVFQLDPVGFWRRIRRGNPPLPNTMIEAELLPPRAVVQLGGDLYHFDAEAGYLRPLDITAGEAISVAGAAGKRKVIYSYELGSSYPIGELPVGAWVNLAQNGEIVRIVRRDGFRVTVADRHGEESSYPDKAMGAAVLSDGGYS